MRFLWHLSSTSLVPGVADTLRWSRRYAKVESPRAVIPTSPPFILPLSPFPHTHLGSAPSALLQGRAAAGPRARPCSRARPRAGLFPPVHRSRVAARGRSGVWWARAGGSCAFPPKQRRRERQRRRWQRRPESHCRVSHPGSGRDPAAAAAEM